MSLGWEGEKARLVPLDKQKHLENAVTWFNDPKVTEWTLVGDLPISRLAEEEFFDRAAKETETAVHFAVETREGEHIGFTAIHQISWRHGTAITGIVIGREKFRGQGYGVDAMRVRTRYAFEVLGLRMLMAEVMAGNDVGLGALQKAGYREVGRIPRRYWKRGAWRDDVLLVIEREPQAAPESEIPAPGPADDKPEPVPSPEEPPPSQPPEEERPRTPFADITRGLFDKTTESPSPPEKPEEGSFPGIDDDLDLS